MHGIIVLSQGSVVARVHVRTMHHSCSSEYLPLRKGTVGTTERDPKENSSDDRAIESRVPVWLVFRVEDSLRNVSREGVYLCDVLA